MPLPPPLTREEQEQLQNQLQENLQKTGGLLPSPQKTAFDDGSSSARPPRRRSSATSPGRSLPETSPILASMGGMGLNPSPLRAGVSRDTYVALAADDYSQVSAELRVLLRLFTTEPEDAYADLDRELQVGRNGDGGWAVLVLYGE